MKNILLIFILVFSLSHLFANSKTDSLFSQIQQIEKKDSAYFNLLNTYLKEKNFKFENFDFDLITESILEIEKSDNVLLKAEMFNWLANYYYQKSQIENAIINYLKAIQLIENTVYRNELLGFRTNLANAYNASSDYNKALELNLNTIELIKDDPSSAAKARYYFYLAKTYDMLRDFKNAEHNYLVALQMAVENKFPIGEIVAKASLGHIYNVQGKFNKALVVLTEAITFYRPSGQSNNTAGLYSEIADSYEGLEQFHKAVIYYDSAIHVYLERENISYLRYNYEKLAFSYTKLNKPNDAFLSYQEALLYADSTYSKERVKAIEEVKIHYETEEYKQQKKLAEANELFAKESARKSKNNSLLAAVFSFLVLLLLIFIYSRMRIIAKQKKKLDEAYLKLEESTKNELAVSNLKALKSQMNPHFIFNLLNSIQALVLKGDIDASYKYMTKFANLVRQTLHFSDADLVDIEDEINLLRIYLELEKLRFPKNFEFEIIEHDLDDIQIPPLLIQPFIENALVHGLLHKEGKKTIKIEFEIKEKLICTITDNGIGRTESKEIKARQNAQHQSFSTKAIKKRFKILSETYKGEFGFKYDDILDGETFIATQVKLYIPFKRIF